MLSPEPALRPTSFSLLRPGHREGTAAATRMRDRGQLGQRCVEIGKTKKLGITFGLCSLARRRGRRRRKKKTAPPFPAPHPRSPLPPLLFRIHYTHTHTHNPSSGVVPPRGRHLLPPRVPRVVRGLLPFPGPRDRGLAAAPRPAQARGVLLDRVAADPRRAAVVRRGGGAGDGRGLCGW